MTFYLNSLYCQLTHLQIIHSYMYLRLSTVETKFSYGIEHSKKHDYTFPIEGLLKKLKKGYPDFVITYEEGDYGTYIHYRLKIDWS